jgi:ATP-dependent DNA helicase DinG
MKGPRPKNPDFEALLGPGGPLSNLPFYEHRPGQVDMAKAVWRALRHDEILLAEAGTGIGKSLAYLLPALHMDRRVVISTGTKALQEQLAGKDLPLCEKLLGRPVRAVTVKGRANYLCLHYWRQFRAQPLFTTLDEGRHFQALCDWADHTGTGDKADWRGIPEGLPTWREVNARGERCLGSHCPLYNECFVVLLRRQAEAAEVVVTNHHLLFADLALKNRWDAAALPEYAHLVLDEAHEAEESATSFFGTSASKHMLNEWLGDAARALKEGGRGRGAGILQDAGQAALFFFGHFEGREHRDSLTAGFLDADAKKLRGRLTMRLDSAALALEAQRGDDEALGLLERLEAWREAFDFALDAEHDGFARWIEVRGKNVIFGSSPIDVGPLLRDHLFSRLNGALLTSATLTVGGRFDYLRGRLGVPPRAEELRVPSPFDYGQQGLLYVPSRFPDPSSEDFQEALCASVAELVCLSRGRAFVLCTSIRSMRAVAQALDGRVPYAVLMQGDEPKGVLLKRFRMAGNAVLVATASFWQGVDVQGEALSLVVLDKIPFAVPSDPVTQARIEYIRKEGEDPFQSFQLPSAAIMLQQGAGRLIRSAKDRGVVACFDVRLRRRAYGRTLLASLPPFRLTHSLEDVEAFFAGEGEE